MVCDSVTYVFDAALGERKTDVEEDADDRVRQRDADVGNAQVTRLQGEPTSLPVTR